jgi:type II secretory pathway pseudopilin PulG
MTILLGATFALLLAAVVLSFMGMQDGVKNTPKDEILRMQTQIEQLRIEQERLALQRQLLDARSTPVPETAGPSEMEKMKEELARKEAEIAALAEEKDDAEKKADTFRDEAGLIGQRKLEESDNELRRSRMIRDALLIGKVASFVANAEVGNFVTIEVVMPEHVQSGAILAIRRNTGILGRVKVSEVTAEGAIASPMPGFGQIEPQVGDELIIPPQF